MYESAETVFTVLSTLALLWVAMDVFDAVMDRHAMSYRRSFPAWPVYAFGWRKQLLKFFVMTMLLPPVTLFNKIWWDMISRLGSFIGKLFI